MQDTTSSIRATYRDIPEHQSLGYPNTFIIILSYQLFSCLSHSEFRKVEYATRRSVKINQGRFETHTETIDDDSTIVGRIE
jgi:hypothetical protein